MSERSAAHDRRQRRLLIALALLFFAPLAVSFFLYYGGDWRPGHRVNRGDLTNPPRPLPDLSLPIARGPATRADAGADHTQPTFLKNKWTLLYWGAGSCSSRCRENLYNMRQVRTALNRDMDRVQRVFIADGECCDWQYLDHEHPDLLTIRATPDAAPLLALLPAYDGISPAAADRVYLIDPLGNLMMSYAPDAKPKGMLEDLKRLLGLSSVG
jgi:cytochrome oxidase Cu insertion factor (SCO1/SenC/PrrC family)